MDPVEKWGETLAQWAIPTELIDAAEESPYFFPTEVFTATADSALARDADTVSDAVALEALGTGGTVLDIGAGAGAASLRLRPDHVTAVDSSVEMLEAFAERADRVGIPHREVHGTWPQVAFSIEAVDVVVCHHVVYNVADLAAFASAIDAHRSRRAVLELTAVHPMTWMTPYWKAMHGIDQPDRPTADDAVAVLRALGLPVNRSDWKRELEMIGELDEHAVARIARRLCLDPERIPELRAVLDDTPPPQLRDVVTLWW